MKSCDLFRIDCYLYVSTITQLLFSYIIIEFNYTVPHRYIAEYLVTETDMIF